MTTKILTTDTDLSEVCTALKKGAVIVIPTETVYGLACDAANEQAINRIYALKNRSQAVPMQLLLPDVESALKIADLDEKETAAARAFWPGEMTLICKPRAQYSALARGYATLGIRVPRHSFVSRLLSAFGAPLAATSANKHGQPPVAQEAEIKKQFESAADYIFTAGDINGAASTVVQISPFKMFREGAIKEAQILQIIKN